MVSKTHQKQVNIRLDDETLEQIDEYRFKERYARGTIPTRSDIVREAIDAFLEQPGERGQNGGGPADS